MMLFQNFFEKLTVKHRPPRGGFGFRRLGKDSRYLLGDLGVDPPPPDREIVA